MLYGYDVTIDGKPCTIVAAADTVEEFEVWASNTTSGAEDGVESKYAKTRATNFQDHLQNEMFKGYKHPVYIFEHTHSGQRTEFANKHELKKVQSAKALDRHLDMLAVKKQEIADRAVGKDKRTIGEIHNLNDERDPWDRRTEAEKAAAKSGKKQLDELRKRAGDRISGQSFDPNPREERSGGDKGLHVNEVAIGADGSLSVSGVKTAATTKATVMRATDTTVMERKAASQVEILKETGLAITALEAAGYSEKEIQDLLKKVPEGEDSRDYVDNIKKTTKVAVEAKGHTYGALPPPGTGVRLGQTAGEIASRKTETKTEAECEEESCGCEEKVEEKTLTLTPEDSAAREELVKRVLTSLDKVNPITDELTARVRHNVMDPKRTLDEVTKISEESIKELDALAKAPKPKPEDYRFAFNAKLTENPAIGGENTPVFTFATNKKGPGGGQFGLSQLNIMVPGLDNRFEMVSGEIYCFNGEALEGHNILLKAGFVEDASIVGSKLSKKESGLLDRAKKAIGLAPEKPKLSPQDFAKAFAGNGTSTMGGTDSWGKKIVGMTEEEVVLNEKGEKVPRGVSLDLADGLQKVEFDALPVEVKNLHGSDLENKELLLGPYNGHVMLGERVLIPLDSWHRVIGEINVRHLGTTVSGLAKVEIYVRTPGEKIGYVLVVTGTNEETVLIIEVK